MKTRDIEFNTGQLVGSVEAFAHHLTGKQKLTLRITTLPLPPRVHPQEAQCQPAYLSLR